MTPSHQKWFLQASSITYLHLNHIIVTITLFVLFICYVWQQRHGSIWVYSNPCIFELFTTCRLLWPKCVKELHEKDLPETTCTIDLFHALLQCLRLVVWAAVGDTIEYRNANNNFEFARKALCHSTIIRVYYLSNKKSYFPIKAVSIDLVQWHIQCLCYLF